MAVSNYPPRHLAAKTLTSENAPCAWFREPGTSAQALDQRHFDLRLAAHRAAPFEGQRGMGLSGAGVTVRALRGSPL
jgi:hypothetical protein